MAGGYKHIQQGTDGMAKLLKDMQAKQDAARSAAGIKSALVGAGGLSVFDPGTAQRARLSGGELRFWADYDTHPDDYGHISANSAGAIWIVGAAGGAAFLNALGVDDDGNLGSAWVQSSGGTFIYAGDGITMSGDGRVYLRGGTGMDILTGGDLHIYELSTTGSSANIRLDPSTAEILYVTSSKRYKTDIADAVVEPREVLNLVGRTWVDKGRIEKADEGPIRRDIGFIAEELDEQPSLRQFVDYDKEGRPDAIQYDRIAVALLAVVKDQQTQIDALTARVEALES